jgi:hypothetical protein
MMGKSRARHFKASLDLVNALAVKAGPHQQAENLEAVFLAQGSELFDALIHSDISSIIELLV